MSIDGNEIEVVNSAKLLGITISDNLTWNAHVNEVVKKASKRLYFLVQLKRARLTHSDLVLFYLSCVRSTVDYGVPAFFNALPQYLKNDNWNELVRIEKMALSIILPSMSLNKACDVILNKPCINVSNSDPNNKKSDPNNKKSDPNYKKSDPNNKKSDPNYKKSDPNNKNQTLIKKNQTLIIKIRP